MLLLSFFVGEELERERRRVLIDTLLRVTKKKAVSVCREAGVQPSNLSRFRRPDGGNLVSLELQDRILAALGWAREEPSSKARHDWVVKDADGLIALEWMMRDRSTRHSQIHRLGNTNTADESLDTLWGGNLGIDGAPCHIAIGSYLSLPSGKSGEEMMEELVGADFRRVTLRQAESDLEFDRFVTKGTLQHLFEMDRQGKLSAQTGGLFDHRLALGLTNEKLDQLVEQWLCRMARDEPETVFYRLEKIEKVRIGGEEISPKSMTVDQLKQYVKNLSL